LSSAPTSSTAEEGDDPIADLVGPHLRVLFCGINPGLASAAAGLHFARPGNRFWKVLHQAGFTDRVMAPAEQAILPSLGLGITNIVHRRSATAAELTAEELRAGAANLERLVANLAPSRVAVLGVLAYRVAFRQPRAAVGLQPQSLAGRPVWVLPNPSGLQAHYQLADMVRLYREMGRDARALA
jgi:TDG/mug DNA glycosylase family protein